MSSLMRRTAAAFAAGALLTGAVLTGTAHAEQAERDAAPLQSTLRDAAAAQGRFAGTAINDGLLSNPTYTSIASREFSSVTAENVMKWETIQPSRGNFNFSGGDRLVDFAQ